MANIVDTLINEGRFVTLVEAINQASFLQGLMEPAAITLFAPTDEAFAKLPSGTVGIFLNNPPELDKLLSYHVIAQRIPSSDIDALRTSPTVEGSTLSIDTSAGLKVNDANVIQPDIEADNGIIHVIDAVLVPQAVTDLLMTV
jgi:uncharacterized surface protein with fasciclin (FAS1) repeats